MNPAKHVKGKSSASAARQAARAILQQLEPRVLLSTYTVNTISDALNPGPGLMSLRQAVAAANAHSGADTINFAANVFTPASRETIALLNGQITLSDKSGATTIAGPTN